MAYRHLLPYSPTLFHYKNRPSIFCTEKSTGGYLQHLIFLPDTNCARTRYPEPSPILSSGVETNSATTSTRLSSTPRADITTRPCRSTRVTLASSDLSPPH